MLHLGDAFGPAGFGTQADDSIGCTITDPPFDARTHRAALEGPRASIRRIGERLPFAPFGPEQIEAAARELTRVTRRWILVFCGERQTESWATALERHGAQFVRLGCAARANPRPQMTGDRPGPGFDPIVIAHKLGSKRWRWNGGGKAGMWRSPAARFDTGKRNVHPSQKPVELMRSLVSDFTEPGELVCDPFAGSGTTAVACKLEGRSFVGWEIDPRYHAVAMQRLEVAFEQRRLVG